MGLDSGTQRQETFGGQETLAAVPASALPKNLPPPHTGMHVYVTAESLQLPGRTSLRARLKVIPPAFKSTSFTPAISSAKLC